VGVYERGQHPVEVVVDAQERAALHRQQRHVQEAVSRLGLTVESNPSSNLLIGEVPHDRHPAFRLQPLDGGGHDGNPMIPVALGDDDPATFASCLPEEYAYIHHALLRQGVASTTALAWLDRVRENGWLARFSLRSSATVGGRAPTARDGRRC
jgi:hypothetical protein